LPCSNPTIQTEILVLYKLLLPIVALVATIPLPVMAATWKEQILNSDRTINWTNYVKVANNLDQRWAIDYMFGPDATNYNPPAAPTLWGATDRGITDGWYKYLTTEDASDIYANHQDWYSNSGQLLYSPDSTDDHGIALARSFAKYNGGSSAKDWRAFDQKISWSGDGGDWYLQNPDYHVQRQPVIDANGGNQPYLPIAVGRPAIQRGMVGIVIYKNGLIAGARNDSQFATVNPAIKLPPGKVPTAVTVTPGNEFAFVTVWDTIAHKGQVAIIAIQGRLDGTEDADNDVQDEFGLPNWFYIASLKLLGFVDLPFAAPNAIASSLDQTATFDARDGNNNTGLLSSQSERDQWWNTSNHLHVAAKAGYAVVTSRAENKVAFLDLKPLYQYYRQMYFTTQAKYDQTQQKGLAGNQWPYTFDYASQQKPTVAYVLDVTEPTSCYTGFPIAGGKGWIGDDSFKMRAFVGTMDGHLQTYNVGGLNTDAPAAAPVLERSVQIGRNPTSITGSTAQYTANQVWVTSRGDRAVYRMNPDGTLINVLHDSRMQDPIYAFSSFGRGNLGTLSVMDFKGRQALNYLSDNITDWPWGGDVFFQVANGVAPFEFSYSTPILGQPFMFNVAEVF